MLGRLSFAGRGCVVTGGSKGIGRAVVEQFLELGGTVITCSRSRNDLDQLAEAVAARPSYTGTLKVRASCVVATPAVQLGAVPGSALWTCILC